MSRIVLPGVLSVLAVYGIPVVAMWNETLLQAADGRQDRRVDGRKDRPFKILEFCGGGSLTADKITLVAFLPIRLCAI